MENRNIVESLPEHMKYNMLNKVQCIIHWQARGTL